MSSSIPTPPSARSLLPDLVLASDGARSGVAVAISGGKVVGVTAAGEGERLPGRALAPGFANAHSHAFQRALRGRTERRDPAHPRDSFWTWRERMYALAGELDIHEFGRLAERCYREMLRAGYTSVAEFHYVHHRPDGSPYADANALAKAVAAAAERAGIRLLLLPAAYARGGIARFRDPDIGTFLRRVDALRGWAEGRPLLEIGVAAHSVRAVPATWLRDIAAYARADALPLHIHADEQPREIEECAAEHGVRPIELLAGAGFLGPETTVLHATHADDRELDLLREAGAAVCACPTTEGNLGDGFLPAEGLLTRGIPVSVGSDSHVRLDPFEEMRELETNARRLSGRRNVLMAPGDVSPAAWLLRAGWQRDGLSPDTAADLIEIDLAHPSIAGVAPEDLPAALVFGAGADVVATTWVGGRRLRIDETVSSM